MNLLTPGAAVMARLRFKGKFALLCLIVAAPLAVMLALLFAQTQGDIAAARLERRGVEYVGSLVRMLHAVQASGTGFAEGGSAAGRDAAAKATDAALAQVSESESRHGERFGTAERAQNIVDHWSAMKKKAGSMSAQGALAEHRALSEEILDLMYFVAERSRLLLDPEGRSAYLQDLSVSRLPEMLAASGHASALMQSGGDARANAQLAMAYQLALKSHEAGQRALINAYGGSDVDFGDRELTEAKAAYDKSAGAFLEALSRRVRGEADADARGASAASMAAALRLNVAALAALDRDVAARASRDRLKQAALLGSVGVSLLLLAYLFVAFWRATQGSIQEAMALAGRIADGDLSHRIDVRTRDEIGELMASLNRMSERMSELVAGVKGSSTQVLTSAREVAQANADLSSRTDRQASSLEEMSASTEELAAAVTQSAAKIQEAGGLVAGASASASASSAAMERAVDTMDEVAKSSRRVADITGVIDGIAFQTNILALNAAVEAARVGEDGRGFAVVAGEIRLLAQRSATAAKEIKDLIEGTVTAIGDGAMLVEEAGGAITHTVAEIARAVTIMKDVGTMAKEQSASIEQISAVVMEMNGVTQQNAAFVQQTSEIANQQEQSARDLVSGVDGFRIDRGSAGASAGAAAPRRLALAIA
ncbi:MAG: methyl-accepting chemotaxis protein [Betaproteobacteria bacterium]